MRTCKCRICGKELDSKKAYCKVTFGAKSGKERKKYYCSEKEFLEYTLTKMKESMEWENLYQYVKYEVFEYDEMQILPRSLITKLRDLRNGVDYVKGKGRVTGCKNGYPYEIILETFEDNIDTIHYCLDTKDFKNESAKVNYIMAIICNTINDTYEKWILRKKNREFEEKKNVISDVEDINLDRMLKENTSNEKEKPRVDNTRNNNDIGNMLQDVFG